MAQRKETKAQRLQREAAEHLALEAQMVATYPARLMEMLDRATSLNFELEVRKGKLVLTDRDDRHEESVELTLTHNKENEQALTELEWRLDIKEAAELESQRLSDLRRQAFLKLSPEEQRALGLNDRNNW